MPQSFQPVCKDFQRCRCGHGNADCVFGFPVSDGKPFRPVNLYTGLFCTDLKAFSGEMLGKLHRAERGGKPAWHDKIFKHLVNDQVSFLDAFFALRKNLVSGAVLDQGRGYRCEQRRDADVHRVQRGYHFFRGTGRGRG